MFGHRFGRRYWAALALCQLLLCPLLLPDSVAAQNVSSDLTSIALIQGAAPASSFDEQDVTTWGVVTGVARDGFYLQDPLGDGNPATSDGLFVYTYDIPTVTMGQCVQVAGEIVEYFGKTELNWITAVMPSEACGAHAVTPVTLPLVRPGDDPELTLEAFEGMVVQLDAVRGVVHGPTKRFAGGEQELAFLPAQWQRYLGPVHLFHDQAAVSALLYLSNRLGATLPTAHWGDLLHVGESALVGVLDYNFGKYQLLPWAGQLLEVSANEASAREVEPGALPALRTEELRTGELRTDEYGICSLNLHGFGQGEAQLPNNADYDVALRQRAQLIAEELVGCTVIALQETGSPDDAHALANMLRDEHGLAYAALAIEGPASREPEFPLTNSMLVDSSRVTVEMVDAVTGCAAQDFDIVAPGVCPLGGFPVFDRPPLMAKLVVSGPPDAPWQHASTVWVINNHWKSKSGDESANARLRAAQATAVAERVQAIMFVDPAAQVVVLGDLNDFYAGDAVAKLQSATGMFHPYEWLSPLDRYTYIFNGAAQVLDHVLVTPNLAPQLALVQIVHVHADAPAGDSPLAHSDHDPIVLRVRPGGAATLGGSLGWGHIEISASDGDGTVVAQATTDSAGEYRLWGLAMGTVTLHVRAPAWIVLDDSTAMPMQPIEVAAGMIEPAMIEPAMPHARHGTAIAGAWVALNTPWLAGGLLAP